MLVAVAVAASAAAGWHWLSCRWWVMLTLQACRTPQPMPRAMNGNQSAQQVGAAGRNGSLRGAQGLPEQPQLAVTLQAGVTVRSQVPSLLQQLRCADGWRQTQVLISV